MIHTLRYWLLRGLLFITPILALTACATARPVPQVVKVPVPVECKIEQVPAATLPTADASMGIFDLVKNALARLKLIEAENVRLRAANTSPCR